MNKRTHRDRGKEKEEEEEDVKRHKHVTGSDSEPRPHVEEHEGRDQPPVEHAQRPNAGTALDPSRIVVTRSRVHNLKDVSISIPKRSMVGFTGVSGSGKSSLVFDTICAEAQRQLFETFSVYQRARLPKIPRPDMDEILNISPVMVIDQKRMGANVRSTIGTVTEVYTHLRLLYSRLGKPWIGPSWYFSFNLPDGMCPGCKGIGEKIDIDVDKLIDWDKSLNQGAIRHQHYTGQNIYFKIIRSSGFFDCDKALRDFTEDERQKLLYSERIKLEGSDQDVVNLSYEGVITGLRRRMSGKDGGLDRASEQVRAIFSKQPCGDCRGTRISARARSVKINGTSIDQLCSMELTELLPWLQGVQGDVADRVLLRTKQIVQHLIEIGVGYLTLDRPVGTLSGGESQRVKMARQLGCSLTDMIYICDEPTVGLHPKDVASLIRTLKQLRDNGNTVLVVEHDPQVMESCDWLVDIGPGAGTHGGRVTFEGTYPGMLKADTVTGEALRQRGHEAENRTITTSSVAPPAVESVDASEDTSDDSDESAGASGSNGTTDLVIESGSGLRNKQPSAVDAADAMNGDDDDFVDDTPSIKRRKTTAKQSTKAKSAAKGATHMVVRHAKAHNLKDVTLKIPLKKFVCFTGVAGAGKSTLVMDEVIPQCCPDALVVDQSAIHRSSRSNPMTFIGCFSKIRQLFASTTGRPAALFSFNSRGACAECKGLGAVDHDMYFLDSVRVECTACHGKRFTDEVLGLKYKGKSIADVLSITVDDAITLYKKAPDANDLRKKLKTLHDVGLGYLYLGQSLSTLSGGEAQRLKLACELHKTGSVYILDEPSTGLHMNDCTTLIAILRRLVSAGNTVIVIEHNMDVIRLADWVIDMGPGGGRHGGSVVVQGTPHTVAQDPNSHTGQWLRRTLGDALPDPKA